MTPRIIITRQILANVPERVEVDIVLKLALFFIIIFGRYMYVARTKVDILQVNRQLFSLVC